MSRNPYFAHLPTWRNRQDLSYALDQLPRILETMTASAPLLATISYPLSSGSSPSSSNPSRSSTPTPMLSSSCSFASASSSSPSSRSCTPQPLAAVAASPCVTSKMASPSAFRERFMMDLTREYQRCSTSPCSSSAPSTRCSSPSSSPTTAAATPFSFLPSSSSSSRPASPAPSRLHPQQQQQQQQRRPPSNVQNLLSLPGGGYYPVQFSTRARAMSFLIEILQSLQKEPCGCDLLKGCSCGPDGYEDHEGKSPCYVCGEWFLDRQDRPRNKSDGGENRDELGGGGAAAGIGGRAWHEQGSLRHHVAEARVKKWLDSVWRPPLTPATTPEQEAIKQFMAISTVTAMARTSSRPLETQQDSLNQHQQTTNPAVRMDPIDRPWGIEDIEIEARTKSRSRQNSASSSFSPISSSGWTPALPLSSTPCGTSTATVSSSSFSPFLPSCRPLADRRHSTPRAGALSDSSESSFVFTTPCPATTATTAVVITPRPSHPCCVRIHRNNIPPLSRANTAPPSSPSPAGSSVLVIPQEILDPSYRSPTFRIKSWNPPPPDSPSPPSSLSPPRPLPHRGNSAESALPTTKLKSEELSSIVKSSFMDSSDRLQAQQQPQPQSRQQQQRERPQQESFKFHFTSQRFHAAIEEATRKPTTAPTAATTTTSDSQEPDSFLLPVLLKDRTVEVRKRRTPKESLPHGTVEVIWQEEIVKEVRDVEISTVIQFDTPTMTGDINDNNNNNDDNSINSNIHSGSSTIQKSAFMSPLVPTGPSQSQDSKDKSASASTTTSNPLMRYKVFNKSHLSFSISAKSFRKSNVGKKQSSLLSPPISPLSSSSSSTSSDVTSPPSSPSMEQQLLQNQKQGQKQRSYKAASWSSLHRLVLKITKNDDGVGNLQRRGRMHLDGP